ncbi:Parkinson disease 7 domain-containing protein 1-like isoform X1 [Biomphalaria glabrata]
MRPSPTSPYGLIIQAPLMSHFIASYTRAGVFCCLKVDLSSSPHIPVEVNRYSALLIPACPGAIHDLCANADLAQIITHFIQEKKPVCAIGHGVAGLFSARKEDGKSWWLEDFCLTAPSLFEVGQLPDFAMLPVLPEDFIKDHGGKYTATEPDGIHVVIDRFLITGQNAESTVTAVQNLILMCSQKQLKNLTMNK